MGIFQQFPYSNFHEFNLDQIIKILREMQDEWGATKTEWASYKDFIDNYFNNLNLDAETEKALRRLVADGTLSPVIDPVIINETIEWLSTHITQPTTPAIDTSLTIAGAAADAKATGDAIDAIKNVVIEYYNDISLWRTGSYSYTDGHYVSSANRICSVGFVDDSILYAETSNLYKMACYAWNGDTYVGNLNTNNVFQTATTYWLSGINFVELKKLYPNYRYKIAFSKQNDTAVISDYVNCIMSRLAFYVPLNEADYMYRDQYLSGSEADLWESGGISFSNGANAATNQRIRTDYINNSITSITTDSLHKFQVFAYLNDVYIGVLNTSTNLFAKATYWISKVDLDMIRSIYPEYRFRIVGSKQDDSNINTTEAVYIKLNVRQTLKENVLIGDSVNLYNYLTTISGQINTSTGEYVPSTENVISKFIKVEPGIKYICNMDYSRIAYYQEDLTFISSVSTEASTAFEFTTPANCKYIRVITNSRKGVVLQINAGSVVAPFEYYYENKIKKEFIPEVYRNYRFSANDIPKLPDPVTVYAIDGSEGYDDDTLTAATIYSWYDALRAAFPDYITKHDLGMDASNTYHLYSYSFRPEPLEDNSSSFTDAAPLPTLLIRGGCHGNGVAGDRTNMIHALYFLMYDVCHNSNDNEFLKYLRHNVNIELLPVMNPWGIDNHSRKNSNGVDLNRNFPYGWTYVQDTTSTVYAGTEPLSEAESQHIKTFIDTYGRTAFCDIDLHTVSREHQTQNHLIYCDTCKGSEMYYVNRSMITELTELWREEHSLSNIPYYGYVDGTNGDGQITSWVTHAKNIPSTIVEGFANIENTSLTTNSRAIMKMCIQEISALIIDSFRYFANTRNTL